MVNLPCLLCTRYAPRLRSLTQTPRERERCSDKNVVLIELIGHVSCEASHQLRGLERVGAPVYLHFKSLRLDNERAFVLELSVTETTHYTRVYMPACVRHVVWVTLFGTYLPTS